MPEMEPSLKFRLSRPQMTKICGSWRQLFHLVSQCCQLSEPKMMSEADLLLGPFQRTSLFSTLPRLEWDEKIAKTTEVTESY
jgi:hypothetical protein